MARLASTSTRSRRCATRAAARCRRSSTRSACASTPARPGSPSIRAPTNATSRGSTSPRSRAFLAPRRRDVEFNIEGDPRPDLLAMVREVRPHQCTLVPVTAGRDHEPGRLAARHAARRSCGRSSRTCRRAASASACSSTRSPAAVEVGGVAGRQRGSSSTPSRSRTRSRKGEDAGGRASFRRYVEAANLAHALGLGINAGHDLDLEQSGAVPDAAAPRRGLDRRTP